MRLLAVHKGLHAIDNHNLYSHTYVISKFSIIRITSPVAIHFLRLLGNDDVIYDIIYEVIYSVIIRKFRALKIHRNVDCLTYRFNEYFRSCKVLSLISVTV